MSPKNFPGRKNDRRKGALSRLKVGADKRAAKERLVLQARILPDDMVRAIRTKKDRSANAKLVRA